MQWVFQDESIARDNGMVAVPSHYQELCAAYGLWMAKPIDIGIPLYCDGTDRDPGHNMLLVVSSHGEGLKLFQTVYLHSAIQSSLQWNNRMALYTVIDYAAATYGRQSLPALVDALGRYYTWQALVPAVYGVSFDEFDRGWQQHVAELAHRPR